MHINIFLILFAFPLCAIAQPDEGLTYPADPAYGAIGTSKDNPVDYPSDNVFHIQLDRQPLPGDVVELCYELKGVAQTSGVAKSINAFPVQGGLVVMASDHWQAQSELVDPVQLRSGLNTLRFGIAQDATYAYEVRNVFLTVKRHMNSELLNFHHVSVPVHDGEGYLSGFIDPGIQYPKVRVGNQNIQVCKGQFEALIPALPSVDSLVVLLYADDVLLESRTVPVLRPGTVCLYHGEADVVDTGARFAMSLEKGGVIDHGRASLEIGQNALEQDTVLSITGLGDRDIPALDPDMVNVTDLGKAYRFLPDGLHFGISVRMQLGYDSMAIPEGYVASDIQTFYFDDQNRRWVSVGSDSVDTRNAVVYSSTNHFTDYINAIITAPETPESSPSISNTIGELEYADPAAGIPEIAVPGANAYGSAQTGFPIKLPPGRAGVAPLLSIDYNSDGSNGWTGLGWDLALPAITIDTRWGVPRYSAGQESETYLYQGQQLYPVAHRSAWVDRTPEKQFYPRVESEFQRIIRHGSNPANYWWEVTEKDGMRHCYGGTPKNGLIESAILRDDSGNITHWAITESRDRNDNFIHYTHVVVQDAGVSGSPNTGRQIYPDAITYTGFKDTEGVFAIDFIRDRELGEQRRTDAEINLRNGFKEVTADLLREIRITYNGTPVRTYVLEYLEGAFNKTLLQSIAETDSDNAEFYRFSFNYYDDIRNNGQYNAFKQNTAWDVPSDGIQGDILNPVPGFEDNASLLNGSKSSTLSVGTAATVGLIGNLATKTNTAGATFGIVTSDGSGLSALVDINGDGLADKVFAEDGRLMYRANMIGSGTTGFGAKRAIQGPVKDFNLFKTRGFSLGAEGHPGGAFVGYEYTRLTNTVEAYFNDFNGDGLIDIAYNGTVYFNHLNPDGDPEFTPDSGDTPSPIVKGADVDPTLLEIDSAEQEARIDQSPLHDVVRMWEAPFNGRIDIDAPVRLVEDPEVAAIGYTKNDGVRVAIQLRGNELWSASIDREDFNPKNPSNVANLQVSKGDRVYFRVQSVFDGAYDVVAWDPAISYRNEPLTERDANTRLPYAYQASKDFSLASSQMVSMPLTGKINIRGVFEKPQTSDDITVVINRKTTGNITIPVFTKDYSWDTITSDTISIDSLEVLAQDEFTFRMISSSNVDWCHTTWMPSLYYVSADSATVITPSGEALISYCPTVDQTMYNQYVAKGALWVAPGTGTAIVERLPFPGLVNGPVTYLIKGIARLYHKETIQVNGGIPGGGIVNISVTQGDTVIIEYATSQRDLGLLLEGAAARVTFNGQSDQMLAGIHTIRSEDDVIFGPMYRNWGQIVYNGNRDRANQPINESELVLDPDLSDQAGGVGDIEDPEDLDGQFNAGTQPYVIMVADPKSMAWLGNDDRTWITKNRISSSRLGDDDITSIQFTASASGISAPFIITETEVNSVSAGAAVGIAGGSASHTWTSSHNILDVMDFNGDQYPDIATTDKIQYTTALGGLGEGITIHGLGDHMAGSNATGFTLGGSYVNSSATNSGDSGGTGSCKRAAATKSNTNRSGKKAGDATRAAESSVGLSGSFTTDHDDTEESWMDINGDGLIDKVYHDGNVALNAGYRFLPVENWGFGALWGGESRDYGAGLGFNYANGSIVGGISFSKTDNWATTGLQDVNGDGLMDQIVSIDPLKVRLNTGSGFGPVAAWNGANYLTEGSSTGESVNAAFTVCIPIPVLGIKICVNPSTAVAHGVSKQTRQIADIDGDGFPDYLSSNMDDELDVKQSAIGQTNLLKSVTNPLGGSFEIEYSVAGNTYGMPYAKWVMSGVHARDGLSGDGAESMYSTFAYADGVHDRHEREFNGFGEVRTQERDTEQGDALYRTTVQQFDVSGYYTRGLVLGEWIEDAEGKRYSETQNTWQLRDVITGSALPLSYQENAAGYAFPALVETKLLFYEGAADPGLQTRMTYAYDSLGNVVQYTDFGDGSEADRYTATLTYHHRPQEYLMGIPATIRIESEGKMLRHRENTIDDTGDMIQLREYPEATIAATTDLTYDVYGNIVTLTRPENAEGQRMEYAYTIDSALNTYVIKIEDSYGYFSEFDFDPVHGDAIRIIDINGLEFNKTLDARGRPTSVTGPYEQAAGVPYTIRYTYIPDATPPYAISDHYDPEYGDDIRTVRFVDGLNRVVQTKTTGSIFTGDGQPDQLLFIIDDHKAFDAFGRVVRHFYPTTEELANPGQYHTDPDPIKPTEIAYDVLDRQTRIVLPDETVTQKAYVISEDQFGRKGRLAMITDALGHQQFSMTDVRDRKMASALEGPDGMIWTHLRYNAISERIATFDDAGNPTEYYYDQLGRKTGESHPDGGLTEYSYDLADNLTSRVTESIRETIPDGGEITYKYDFERLTEIDYPKHFENQVRFHYGEPGAPFNRAGRIWLREDASGGEEFFFGLQGEVEKSIRTLLVQQSVINTFVSEYQYDSWGRIQQVTYPDGEEVDFAYNRAGDLTRMTGKKTGREFTYLRQVGYDKFNEMQFIAYGNGTETTYRFDPARRWLSQVQTHGPQGDIMQLRYQYDALGNVVSYSNDAPSIAHQPGGPTSYEFFYDAAYRLTHAEGTWQGNESRSVTYEGEISYDNLQNIRQNRQLITRDGVKDLLMSRDFQYLYDSDRPHAPAAISGVQYNYDGNGNLAFARGETTFRFKQCIWDEENRLIGVSDNGYLSRFTYAGDGQRAIKSHGASRGIFVDGMPAGVINHAQNYSAYVSPFITTRKTSFTKHYYLNGQRFLSKIGTGQFDQTIWPSRGLTAGNLDYVKRMNLLQQAANQQLQQAGLPPGPPTLPYYYAQPDISGIPTSVNVPGGYTNPPPHWPGPPGPPDPSGPPGPPTWFAPPVDNASVRAGYNFTGDGIFQEVDQFYYHTDQLGSSAYITDINGEVRQHMEYTAFGEILVDEHRADLSSPYLFNGKEYDSESGFYYYGARYFDPQTALWLSIDPLAGDYPGWSPYVYVLNNPQSLVDPDGMAPGDLYSSPNKAAMSFAMRYNPRSIAEDREYGGAIYRKRGRNGKTYYAYTHATPGGHAQVNIPSAPINKKTNRRYTVVADIHTHGAYDKGLSHGNNVFSPTDKRGNEKDGTIGYVATPNGYLQRYEPKSGQVSKISGHIPYDKKHYRKGRPADVARAERNQRLAAHRTAINLGQTNAYDFEAPMPAKANATTRQANRRYQFRDGNTRG